MNTRQRATVITWLAAVSFLALVPPFSIHWETYQDHPFTIRGETRHHFLLSGRQTPVNMPVFSSMDPNVTHGPWENDPVVHGPWEDYQTKTAQAIPYLETRVISLSTLFCELMAVSAVAGLAFISLKDKQP